MLLRGASSSPRQRASVLSRQQEQLALQMRQRAVERTSLMAVESLMFAMLGQCILSGLAAKP
jgi:hypothetical protein